MSGNHNRYQKQKYQCPSCGGFCKRSGCERENAPEPTSAEYDNVVATNALHVTDFKANAIRERGVVWLQQKSL